MRFLSCYRRKSPVISSSINCGARRNLRWCCNLNRSTRATLPAPVAGAFASIPPASRISCRSKKCLAVAEECEAPMVSICGGEPLIYPKIETGEQPAPGKGRIVYYLHEWCVYAEENEGLPSRDLFSSARAGKSKSCSPKI